MADAAPTLPAPSSDEDYSEVRESVAADKPITAERAGLIPDTSHPLPHISARGACLATLTVLAVLFALKYAAEFMVPLVMAIVIAYALDPAVAFMDRRRVPRVLGTLIVMLFIVGVLCGIGYVMQDQVSGIINSLPEISSKVSRTLGGFANGDGSFIDKLRGAAAVFQEANKATGARRVVVDQGSGFEAMLLSGAGSLATFLGQATMVLFLVFFLLLSGNTFKRKFVKVAGTSLSQKKISVHMLDQINHSIHMYMMMMLVTNVALGVLTWGAFRILGLENAATWAVVAAALHIIPYFGPLLTAIGTGVAAMLQFGQIGPALVVMGSSIVIAMLIGVVVTTWMSGRIAKMNAVAVFVVLLLFTWLWGIWGTLLSIPIAFIAKVVADHIEGMEAVAEFLGE